MTVIQWFGLLLFLHDIRDVPKLDRVHHWQIGALLVWFGG